MIVFLALTVVYVVLLAFVVAVMRSARVADAVLASGAAQFATVCFAPALLVGAPVFGVAYLLGLL